MSVSGPLHNRFPTIPEGTKRPQNPPPSSLKKLPKGSDLQQTNHEEATKRYIDPDYIFHGALTRLPEDLKEEEDMESYYLAMQNLRRAYDEIVHSLSLEGKQALTATLNKATKMMNSKIAESDKLTALLAGVISAFNPSDSNFKHQVLNSDLPSFERINQLRSAFYKVLDLTVSSKKRETAQNIMDNFYKPPLTKLPGLQSLKLLADRKDDVFSKLVVILPDLFKQIEDKDLKDTVLLISLKGILKSAKQLPSRFTSTLNLDSSGQPFKKINAYREYLVNLLITNKPKTDREKIIELLKADYPKKVKPN